jgi:hypothetical protein
MIDFKWQIWWLKVDYKIFKLSLLNSIYKFTTQFHFLKIYYTKIWLKVNVINYYFIKKRLMDKIVICKFIIKDIFKKPLSWNYKYKMVTVKLF